MVKKLRESGWLWEAVGATCAAVGLVVAGITFVVNQANRIYALETGHQQVVKDEAGTKERLEDLIAITVKIAQKLNVDVPNRIFHSGLRGGVQSQNPYIPVSGSRPSISS